MAEFQEVIKQALRMEEKCSGANRITLDVYEDGMITSESIPAVPLAKFESIIMEWAAANPEPRYPTFSEHIHSILPTCNDDEICVEFLYGEEYVPDKKRCLENNIGKCVECWNSIMPKELADRLGVKPTCPSKINTDDPNWWPRGI